MMSESTLRSVLIGAVVLLETLFVFADAGYAASPYTAKATAEFTHHGVPPLRMPTGLAVSQDGILFVVDGLNDRLLQFDAEGRLIREITRIGEESLSRPISARFDAAGRLWISDTGHGRVLIRTIDGRLDRVLHAEPQAAPEDSSGGTPQQTNSKLVPPSGQGGPSSAVLLPESAIQAPIAPDITDAVPIADGRSAWLVDNDRHRLVRMDLNENKPVYVGELGESLGQFQHPFKMALGREGDLFVIDAINSRVQILTAAGRPSGSIGTYGADLGQLYRPTGVAVDHEQNVWVADGGLGVIQIFSALGGLRDVLRDEQGHPLHLEMPMDLAFDSKGRLYVVELLADRVRRFELTHDAQVPKPAAAPKARPAVGGQQGRSCTICHLEWMEPFDQGLSTALCDPPVATADQPAVSRDTSCLSCHNGVVADSRRRIWQEHGHGTNILPPPGMTVPSFLPLVEGRVVCRTCHTAHAGGLPMGDIKTTVFLRVPGQAGELCILCHPDKTRGPELGTHPTGGMPWPVPQTILEAGGRTGTNPRELTCRVCHTPHGAAYDHLLVMGVESNQLCLTCHEQMRPGMFREGAAEHPLSPQTDSAQMAAVRELGTRLGPENRLICLSCHKLHHGKGKRFMLAEELSESRFCLRCHEDHRVLFGSPHDLRKDYPNEKNRLGMTPESGGPCSSCHMFHRYARAPEDSAVDPGGGKCITCHSSNRVARAKVLPPLNHPKGPCSGCHNPHRLGEGKFLPDHPSEACAKCHAEQVRLVGGRHDVARSPSSWPVESVAVKDPCLACHRPHGTEETGLFRAGLAPGTSGPDGGCLRCHGAVMPQSGSTVELVHTQDASSMKEKPKLPMAGGGPDAARLACRTCHDPHGGTVAPVALLRSPENANAQQMCMVCHPNAASIHAIGHAIGSLKTAGFESDACRPCHVMHAPRETVEMPYLWPRNKLPRPTSLSAETAITDSHCTACHRLGGLVAPPPTAVHPKADMYNATELGAPGYLPLFNARGEVDMRGRISCLTCHFTHGRSAQAPLPEGVMAVNAREVRARQWHLRTFGTGSVCTTCHGFDALRRFMYFHDPVRRSGAIDSGPRRPS